MFDPVLARLQYEILNRPLKDIASAASIPESILSDEATAQGWTQLWPSDEALLSEAEVETTSGSSVENYIECQKLRLKAYSLAKETLLAQRYLELECKLIENAAALLHHSQRSPREVKELAAVYKDLTSGSNLSNLASMTFGKNGDSLPVVLVRDLSGQTPGQ